MRYGHAPARAAAAAGLILLAGCVTSTQATRLQKDLDDVKRQLFQVQQETTASRTQIEEVARRLGPGAQSPSSSQAQLGGAIQTLLDQVQALSERLKESNSRMASLAQDIEGLRESARRAGAPGPTAPAMQPTAPAAGVPAGSQADQTFKTAYADYSKGNYELAVMGFNEFLRSAQSHPLACDAQYFIGECYYSQGKFTEAAESFDQVLQKYPSGERVAAALLKKGYAQIESGQTSAGVSTLQRLIDTHSDSGEARLAAERLKQLGLRSR
ncbi:MAG TPA: tetratricopeptide repeat protein [Candidatus Polarisedimenticolia bacterium]